jgi:drug/metabolite transporter (DMT)-like permease
MEVGILAGLLAGALWGLTFVAPLAAAPYTPLDLMMLRYLVFGLGSLATLAPGGFALLRSLKQRDLAQLVALGAAGNVFYFGAMALAVPRIGSAVVALIIGCLPVVMGLLGNRGNAQIAWRRLAPPLALVVLGLLSVNGAALLDAHDTGDLRHALAGFGLAFAALGLWCWYGLANARAIARRPHLSGGQWTALTGVGTLLALLPVIPLCLASGLSSVPALGVHGAGPLLAWGIALGLLCSWCATWAWSIASRRLPVSLAAQLIVAETLFALLYGAVYQRELPAWSEISGAICLLAGVFLAIRAFANNSSTL